jgi:tetratricopeptide (TPR) repeat protein
MKEGSSASSPRRGAATRRMLPQQATAAPAGAPGAVSAAPSDWTNRDNVAVAPDDSFSEEPFVIARNLRGASSWDESHNYDGEGGGMNAGGRLNRTASYAPRDRRKQFDTTTPTLIDEIDEEEGDNDDDEAEIISLAAVRTIHGTKPQQEEGLRRTPGASMYKSSASYDEGSSSATQSLSALSMRRTPGAVAMHRSRTMSAGDSEKDASSLGFGLTLSTPVASSGSDTLHAVKGGSLWESYDESSGATASLSSHNKQETSLQQQNRPPLPPASASMGGASDMNVASSAMESHTSSAIVSRPVDPPRGPFTFTPWARRHQQSNVPDTSNPNRHGAFSPNMLRLTEDIGNLLHEDEDDDYALEIPSVFKGEDDIIAEDWTGSYIFDPELGRRSEKPAVPRPSSARDPRSRRRGTPSSAHAPAPSNTQQPKPRKSGNDVFEFGKARDERASPRLLNFGGAFAPPPKDQMGSFLRPVASKDDRQPAFTPIDYTMSGSSHFTGLPSQSFESYRPAQQYGMPDGYPSYRFTPPSTTPMPIQISRAPQSSDMQVTAREFYPGSSAPPQQQQHHQLQQQQHPLQHQQQQQQQHVHQYSNPHWQPVAMPPPHMSYDAPPFDWQAHGAVAYQHYGPPKFTYGMPAQGPPAGFHDHRGMMTPSPHMWPQGDMYSGFMPSSVESRNVPLSVMPPGGSSMPSAMPPIQSTMGVDQGNRGDQSQLQQFRLKQDTKRGKRGKKKSKAEKIATTKKKSTKGDILRPGSRAESQDGKGDEALASVSEDPIDAKRAELVESPAVRIAFKDFYRSFRSEERLSFQKAEEFALAALDDGSLPESVHWRVYLELADLAKRSNRYVEARRLYQQVCQLQPCASQGWLEYSKLEEECGHMNRVTNILHAGLEFCEYSENLLTRAVKHQEKMGNLAGARELLARLKHVGIDKVWRTVLEGALLEARAGNDAMARRVLKYLMHHVPWYGPLYLEAYKLERDLGHPMDALQIVERGLNAIPRYGPLWFGAFRLCEEMDTCKALFHLPSTMDMIDRASSNISKELVWKVHLEAAQMLERAAVEQLNASETAVDSLLMPSRQRFALTILTCPHNLRWKVWLAAARMELSVGNTNRARTLFLRAHKVVPDKGRSSSLLECARLEEFVGETDLARAILCKGRVDYGHDWKVWLESVLLEIRNGENFRAMEIGMRALEFHYGTGRLWATLVQLSYNTGGDKAQQQTLRRALNAVPKSGEVWCEGGRIHLNPFSDTFDLDRARRHLFFATKFTPQYGDSFVESIRFELLNQWLHPVALYIWKKTKSNLTVDDLSGSFTSLAAYINDITLVSYAARQKDFERLLDQGLSKDIYRELIPSLRKKLRPDSLRSVIDLNDLRLSCANADPNYGSLWFQCRRVPTDTPRRVIEDAAEDVADALQAHVHLYLAAMVRRLAVLSPIESLNVSATADAVVESVDAAVVEWEVRCDQVLQTAPSLYDMLKSSEDGIQQTLLSRNIDGTDFITGLTHLNNPQPIISLSLLERRKALFGTDALFP